MMDLNSLREIFTSALASDCLDAMGYGRQVLNEDIHMLSGEGVMLGYAFPVQIEIVESFPEVPYVGLLKALDAIMVVNREEKPRVSQLIGLLLGFTGNLS